MCVTVCNVFLILTHKGESMLSQLQVKNAKPKEKTYQLNDGAGLLLRITPNGKKSWIINKSVKGNRISKKIGSYPEMSIKDARDVLASLIHTVEPSCTEKSFESVFGEWLDVKKSKIKNWKDIQERFELYILPSFAKREISSIAPFELINVLKSKLLSRGKLETIKRICGPLKEIEVFALNYGYIDALKWQGIQSVFPSAKANAVNRPSIPWQELPQALKEIQINALKARGMMSVITIAFYTLLRPNEYCSLQWDWIDFENDIINVPADIMKMKKAFRVPLSSQLKSFLNTLPKISKYVLCSPEGTHKPFTINAMSLFLRRHGFKDRLVPHGIRSIGRTWMHDNDIPFDVAEKCLAHSIGTSTQLAYDRSDLLDKRRDAMQVWCDYVEGSLSSKN